MIATIALSARRDPEETLDARPVEEARSGSFAPIGDLELYCHDGEVPGDNPLRP